MLIYLGQISSVCFFLCIYFETKWMNRSIKIFHRCLLLFPISQAIFEFHLEKMTRLWRRSNFGANFRFLRKKWTGNLLHPSEQPVIRRSNVRRIRRVRKNILFERFQIFLYDFSDMRLSVVMKKNNFIMSLLVFRPFFSQCTAQTNPNCSRYRSPVMESSGFSS